MAKAKKGKQKQDEAAQRAVPATIPEETEAEMRSPKSPQVMTMSPALGAFSENTGWGAPEPVPVAQAAVKSPHNAGFGGWGGGQPLPPAMAAKATPQSAARQTLFGPATDDEDEEDYDSYDDDELPAAPPPGKPGWQSWGEEARRLSKVTPSPYVPPGLVGTKAQVSSQQRSQILNSLLSQTPQNNDYLKYAQAPPKTHHQPARAHTNSFPGHNAHPAQHAIPGQQSHAHAGHQSHTAALATAQLKNMRGPGADLTDVRQMYAKMHQDNEKQRKHQSVPGNTWGQPDPGGWGNAGGAAWGDQFSSADEDDDWEEDDRKVRFASGRAGGGGGGGWGGGSSSWGDEGWGAEPKTGGGGGWGDDDWGAPKGNSAWGNDARSTAASGGWGADPPKPSGNASAWGGGWGATPQSTANATLSGGWGAGPEPRKDTVPRTQDTGYVMPSKTLTHAYKGTAVPLNFVDAHNKLNEYTNVKFTESHGEALSAVNHAFFGKERKARERIRWAFPPDKDPRVSSVLDWIDAVEYSLGAYGLHKFLQTQERGALLVNAAYRHPSKPSEPAFDWLIFDQLQKTYDKVLQESVAFYQPEKQTVVFVFLPSPSGNSVAIWRRRINVPNNIRLMLQAQIRHAMAGLRHEKDYLVYVDEKPNPDAMYGTSATGKDGQRGMFSPRTRKGSIPPLYTAPDGVLTMKKGKLGKVPKAPKDPNKKRKWWHIF